MDSGGGAGGKCPPPEYENKKEANCPIMEQLNGDVLAIDPGVKRCGLAIYSENVVIPYKVVATKHLEEELTSLVRERGIKVVVIGKGGDRITGPLARKIGEMVQKKTGCKVFFVDEHYTTRFFERRGIRERVDVMSAALLLETFLKSRESERESGTG